MATRVRYQLAEGSFSLPPQYGAVVLTPGACAIVADTAANVLAALGNPPSGVVELLAVPDGQSGAITPLQPYATAAAQATNAAQGPPAALGSIATAAAQATNADLAARYTGGTGSYWTGGAPTSIQNAVDRIAGWIKSGGATGPIPRVS